MLKLPARTVRKCFEQGEELPLAVVEERIKQGRGVLVFVSSVAKVGYTIGYSPNGQLVLYTLIGDEDHVDLFDTLIEIMHGLALDYMRFRYVSSQTLADAIIAMEDEKASNN